MSEEATKANKRLDAILPPDPAPGLDGKRTPAFFPPGHGPDVNRSRRSDTKHPSKDESNPPSSPTITSAGAPSAPTPANVEFVMLQVAKRQVAYPKCHNQSSRKAESETEETGASSQEANHSAAATDSSSFDQTSAAVPTAAVEAHPPYADSSNTNASPKAMGPTRGLRRTAEEQEAKQRSQKKVPTSINNMELPPPPSMPDLEDIDEGQQQLEDSNRFSNTGQDPAVPRPVPLNRNGHFAAVGAFSLVGPSGINPAQDLGSLEYSMGAGLAVSSAEMQEGGLLVATPVLEEDDPHPSTLPQAIASETKPHSYNQSTGCRMSVLLGILALIVTAVLLGVFVPKRKKEGSSKEEEPSTRNTLSPTQAPTSLEELILSKLPPKTVDTILAQAESPQARAFKWVLNDIDYSHEHIIQRYILAVLYYGTNGEEWLANDFWLDHNVSECEWYNKHNFGMKEELLVSIPYFLDGFAQPPASERCNDDGLYSHLWLDVNGLVGSIPEELYLMDSLKTLGLGFNQIGGTLSTSVGLLTDLIGLFIPFAAITGTLPSQLGLLSSLEVANFYVNGLSGQVPDTIWSYPNMTSWVITSSNPQLEPYMLPTEIGIMTNMRWFGVEQSNTYGTFPTEIGLMRDMVGFWCSGVPGSESVYTGTLPTEFGLMTNVLTIEVNFNALTGTVPTEFGQLEKLNYLNLQNNSLTGPLPQVLELLSNLDNTLIQGNDFTGIVPEALCNMNGSCYAYPIHCASLEQPLQFDCSADFCGCECSCNSSAI